MKTIDEQQLVIKNHESVLNEEVDYASDTQLITQQGLSVVNVENNDVDPEFGEGKQIITKDVQGDINMLLKEVQLRMSGAEASAQTLSKHIVDVSDKDVKKRWETLLPILPTYIRSQIPSILNPLSSIPFHTISCCDPTNQPPELLFKIFLQRELRVPLFSAIPQTCICQHSNDIVFLQ